MCKEVLNLHLTGAYFASVIRAMRHHSLFESVEQIARLGSIRAAAEAQSITSTALNRQIIALEDELGQPLFERLPRGVRLNVAGEMFLIHARQQVRDFERLKVQLDDLSGVRRGHITIASTKAAIPYFLPQQINSYLSEHPKVSFQVNPCDIETAQEQLINLEADIAIVFEPLHRREFQTIESVDQEIVAVFNQHHPLAKIDGPVRLSECFQFPLAVPATVTGVRSILDLAVQKKSQLQMQISVESEDSQFLLNMARTSDQVTFDIPLGLSKSSLERNGLKWRPVHLSDIPTGYLYVGHLKNRSLSIAAIKFANHIVSALQHHEALCE